MGRCLLAIVEHIRRVRRECLAFGEGQGLRVLFDGNTKKMPILHLKIFQG